MGKKSDFCLKSSLVIYKSFFSLTLAMLFFFLVKSASADSNRLWLDATEHTPPVDIQLPSFAPVIEKLSGAVANISIEGKENIRSLFPGGRGPGGPGDELPFDFFGQPLPKERRFSTLGSGFVIHPDGYLVTNSHVVDKATKIFVSFKDEKQRYTAKVVGKDKKTDLALLKIDGVKNLPAVVLADSEKVRPGDWVIAIGNPFLLGHTATVGIVSAKSRHIPGGGPYDDYIQTDASINPGNSGGPLFNARGEVIGVNTAIFSPGMGGGQAGFNIGIGFAIPVNMVKDIVEQLHHSGKVTRGWLGVLIQPVSADMAQAMKLKNASGALVADVLDKSPAKKAGIVRGDVIIKFDGRVVEENEQLPLMVANTAVGKVVDVVVLRKNQEKTIGVTIEELQDDAISQDRKDEDAGENKLGMSVQELTPDIARTLGLEEDLRGVLVARLDVDGTAALSGLRPKDVILEMDNAPITSVSDFRKAAEGISSNKPVLVLVRRGDNTIFLTLKAEEE